MRRFLAPVFALVLLASLLGYAHAEPPNSLPFDPYLRSGVLTPQTSGLAAWVAQRKRDLDAGGTVAQTARGPIEYKKRGSGPVVLCMHGGPGGYDQSFNIGEALIAKGFTVIGVSRPGYLHTPLSVGVSAEEQADAMMALLDTLGIQQAASCGFSAGSIVAFQMAARYPKRIWAAVLQSVGSLPVDFQPGGTYDQLRELASNPALIESLDLASWFSYELARTLPATTANLTLSDDVLSTMPQQELYQRISYVNQSPAQTDFLRKLVYSLTPFSLHRVGLYNDIKDHHSIDPWQDWINQGLPQQVYVPTLIVQSVWDGNGNYAEAKNLMLPNIPNGQLLSVQGAGHFVWLGKNTDAWTQQMANFLNNHKP